MYQRAFSIIILLALAITLLEQCWPPAQRNAAITGEDDNSTPIAALFAAAGSGSVETMNTALGHGADLNARNRFDWTPLMIATFYEQEDCVRCLIKRGADVNAISETGVTSLLIAARRGNRAILNDLIEAGGDIHAADAGGRNALTFASESLDGAPTKS